MRVGNTLDNLQDETEWTLKMTSACQTLLNEALTGMLGWTPPMFTLVLLWQQVYAGLPFTKFLQDPESELNMTFQGVPVENFARAVACLES